MRDLAALAVLLAIALMGCGNSLQSADPSLEITCIAEPNSDPQCTQGSGVRVSPVHQGDDCGNGRKWLPISSYQADAGIMRCQAPPEIASVDMQATAPPPAASPPVTVPQVNASCTTITTRNGTHVSVVSNGGADCATVTGIVDSWSDTCTPDGSRCSVHDFTCQTNASVGFITTCSNSSGTKEIRFESD